MLFNLLLEVDYAVFKFTTPISELMYNFRSSMSQTDLNNCKSYSKSVAVVS